MEIEAARTVVAQVPLPVTVQAEIRRRARVRSTHYSTRIEGNRLTLEEAQEVIDERRTTFRGREQCLRSFSELTASPPPMWQERSGYLTAWHARS